MTFIKHGVMSVIPLKTMLVKRVNHILIIYDDMFFGQLLSQVANKIDRVCYRGSCFRVALTACEIKHSWIVCRKNCLAAKDWQMQEVYSNVLLLIFFPCCLPQKAAKFNQSKFLISTGSSPSAPRDPPLTIQRTREAVIMLNFKKPKIILALF